MRIASLLAIALIFAGCSGESEGSTEPTTTGICPDDAACASPSTTPTTSGSSTTFGFPTSGTTTGANGTVDENATVPGAATLDGETRITMEFSGTDVRRVILTTSDPFTLDDVNHVPGGNGAPTSYGVALWPLGGPVIGPACSDAASLLVWDARSSETAIGWDEVPAGTYEMWVWNEESDGISIEFNGAASDLEPLEIDGEATNWTVAAVVPELSAPAPTQSTQSFSQSIDVAVAGILLAEYVPPSGQPDPSSSMSITSAGTTCASASSDAPATPSVFGGATLRAAAALGPGTSSWDGEYAATTTAFGTFDDGAAIGVLLSADGPTVPE